VALAGGGVQAPTEGSRGFLHEREREREGLRAGSEPNEEGRRSRAVALGDGSGTDSSFGRLGEEAKPAARGGSGAEWRSSPAQ
jgi:hypothetical protein